jgi:hypothetical protein
MSRVGRMSSGRRTCLGHDLCRLTGLIGDPSSPSLIDEHFGERTRLVITHAPQRVPRADRVIELRDGRLIEHPLLGLACAQSTRLSPVTRTPYSIR